MNDSLISSTNLGKNIFYYKQRRLTLRVTVKASTRWGSKQQAHRELRRAASVASGRVRLSMPYTPPVCRPFLLSISGAGKTRWGCSSRLSECFEESCAEKKIHEETLRPVFEPLHMQHRDRAPLECQICRTPTASFIFRNPQTVSGTGRRL